LWRKTRLDEAIQLGRNIIKIRGIGLRSRMDSRAVPKGDKGLPKALAIRAKEILPVFPRPWPFPSMPAPQNLGTHCPKQLPFVPEVPIQRRLLDLKSLGDRSRRKSVQAAVIQ
jgi:hypothetical protein